MTTTPITPRQAAAHIWKLGANITAIPAGGKRPAHEWNNPNAPWATQRQPRGYVDKLDWPTSPQIGRGGRLYPPIETVGIICGVGTDVPWRNIDIDARKGPDGMKIPVPESVLRAILAALGLPADYPWCGRSKSGAGWHVDVRCAGELPEQIAAASSDTKAADGGGAGVKIGLPLDVYAEAFSHIELRWEYCQAILPRPTGYNEHLPPAPPAEVTVDQVVAAFLAVAAPKPRKAVFPTLAAPHPAPPRPAPRIHFMWDDAVRATIRDRFDLVAWFCQELGGETQEEPGGEVRILGHHGLLINPEKQTWYVHGAGIGGDWAAAIAYTRYGGTIPTAGGFFELVQIAANFAGVTLSAAPRSAPSSQPPAATGAAQTIRWGDEIDTITLPRSLVKGYLNIGTVALFVGPSEAGKSTIAVDLACKVAAHYPVIYVAGEDAGNVRTQIRAWELTANRSRGRLGLRDTPLLLSNIAQVDAFIAEAAPHAPRLVVIDTLSTCAPGIDENSSEMTIPVAQLNRIADELNAAVLVLHHPTKSDNGQYRGHSSILNNTHTMWVARRDAGDDLVMLDVTRHKGRKAEPAALRLVIRPTDISDPDEGTLAAPVALPAERIILTDSHINARERTVLQYLNDLDADGGATIGDICRHVVAEIKTAEGNVRRAIASLVKRGLMSAAEKQREPRQITEKGRKLIECDPVRSSESVAIGGGFIVNVNLGNARQPDHNLITSGASFLSQPDAVLTPTDSHLITPDHTRSDQVPTTCPEPDHLIRSFRSDQVIGFGAEGGLPLATVDPTMDAAIDSAVARWEEEHTLTAWNHLQRVCGIVCRPTEALQARGVSLLPPDWRLLSCDYRGYPARYGVYVKAEGSDGTATAPDQHQPAVIIEAWRLWDPDHRLTFDEGDDERNVMGALV